MDKPTEQIAHYASTLTLDEVPEEARHAVKRLFIDSIACAFAAYPTGPVGAARTVARSAVSQPPAHVLISGEPTTPDLAAYAGGLMVRYWDLNDTYLHGGHPSDTIAGLLAVAETTGASGADTLTALIIAYETFCALSDTPRSLGTSAAGRTAIAAAAGAVRLLGLDGPRAAQAVSLAAAMAINRAARGHGPLSMWRAGMSTNGARNGIVAAQLAAAGIEGPPSPFVALGAGEDEALLPIGGRGHAFRASGTHMKVRTAEYAAQAAIGAALELRESIQPSRLREIVVHTYRHAAIGATDPSRWAPDNVDTALHAIPYLVALALCDGDVSPTQLTPQRLADPALRELASRVQIVEDPKMTESYPAVIATWIEALADDGKRQTAECRQPKGHAANPLTDAEIEAKLARYATGIITPTAQAALLAQAWALEEQRSVEGLLAALRSNK